MENQQTAIIGAITPPPPDIFPLFSCKQWNEVEGFTLFCYCGFEKLILVFDVLLFVIFARQIWIYVQYYGKGFKDLRVVILCLCLMNCIDTFIHYGIITP